MKPSFENQIWQGSQPIGSSFAPLQGLDIAVFDGLSEGLIQYNAVFDDGGVLTDLLFLYINSLAIQLFAEGYRKEELIGKTMRQVLGGTFESDLTLFSEVNKTGIPHGSEKFDEKSGKWYLRHIEKSGEGFIVFFFDITSQKNHENDLKLSQSVLSNIVNSSNYRVIARDLNERLFLINDRASEILKVPKNLAIGKTPYDLYPQEIADKLVEDDRQVIQKGEACQLQEEIPIEGNLRSFLTNKFPLRDNAGNTFGIGIISTDVTQLREAHEVRVKFLEMIFSQTNFGIAIMNLDGRIVKVNSAYESITGYPEEEIKSKGLPLFTYARDIKEEISLIRAVASKLLDNYTLNRRVICRDGSIKWVRLTGEALFSKEKWIFTTIDDITQEKLIERQLEKYRAALEDLLEQRTAQLLNAKRNNVVSSAAGLVGQQLLMKYIFRREFEDSNS